MNIQFRRAHSPKWILWQRGQTTKGQRQRRRSNSVSGQTTAQPDEDMHHKPLSTSLFTRKCSRDDGMNAIAHHLPSCTPHVSLTLGQAAAAVYDDGYDMEEDVTEMVYHGRIDIHHHNNGDSFHGQVTQGLATAMKDVYQGYTH